MTKTEDTLMAFIQKQTEAMEKQQEAMRLQQEKQEEAMRLQQERQDAAMREQQAAMREQQEAMREQEKKFLATIAKLAAGQRRNVDDDDDVDAYVIPSGQAAVTRQMSQLSSRMPMFRFDAEYELTFSKWYDRHGDVITVDGAELDEGIRTRLLLEKLDDDAFNKYKRQILPKIPADMSYEDTVKMLKEMFDVKSSTFTTRYQCLKIEKSDAEDLMEYTGRVNESCEKAKLHDLDSDGLKSLVWIYGLKSAKDSDIRSRMLAFLDREYGENKKVTVHELFKEAAHYISLKRDARMIEDRFQVVQKVSVKDNKKDCKSSSLNECWNCGRTGHRSEDCYKPDRTCEKCDEEGHMEKYCDRIKQLRQRLDQRGTKKTRVVSQVVTIGKTEVEGSEDKRQFIDVTINDKSMSLQLDTGSDISLIDEQQWSEMGRPPLEPSNLIVENASGNRLQVYGRLWCNFVTPRTRGAGYAYVTPRTSLMGLEWIQQCDDMMYHLRKMAELCGIQKNRCSGTNDVKKTVVKKDPDGSMAPVLAQTVEAKRQLGGSRRRLGEAGRRRNKLKREGVTSCDLTMLPEKPTMDCRGAEETPRRDSVMHSWKDKPEVRCHRAWSKKKKFVVGTRVLVQPDQGQSCSWIPGTVMSNLGSKMFDVLVSGEMTRRHAHQMKLDVTGGNYTDSRRRRRNVVLDTVRREKTDSYRL